MHVFRWMAGPAFLIERDPKQSGPADRYRKPASSRLPMYANVVTTWQRGPRPRSNGASGPPEAAAIIAAQVPALSRHTVNAGFGALGSIP
jgi:hypothetical protein